MSLAVLPADIFVLIAQKLKVNDVLSLRKVCKRLGELSHLRAVWHYFVCQACAAHGIARFPAQFGFYDTSQLEDFASRPLKLQLGLLDTTGVPHRHSLPTPMNAVHLDNKPGSLSLLRERALSDDMYTATKISRGGRWLSTLSRKGMLRVWDLDHPTNPRTDFDPTTSNPTSSSSTTIILSGQLMFDPYWTLVDVDTSPDGRTLNVLMSITIVRESTSLVYCLDLTPRADLEPVPELIKVATLRHQCDFYPSSFRHDLVTLQSDLAPSFALWNWKKGYVETLQLQRPPWATETLRMKLVSSRHLVVVHSARSPTKCNASVYTLPPPGCPQQPQEFAQSEILLCDSTFHGGILEPLQSHDLRGMHHVQVFESPASLSARPSSPPADLDFSSPGASPPPSRRALTFSVGSVVVSEPYWAVTRCQLPDIKRSERVEQFKVCIAVESLLLGSRRTRLHYILTVNLGSIPASGELDSLVPLSPSGPMSPQTTDPSTLTFTPAQPRGRLSTDREGSVYYRDRIAVAIGSKSMISVWTTAEGVRAHISRAITKKPHAYRLRSTSFELNKTETVDPFIAPEASSSQTGPTPSTSPRRTRPRMGRHRTTSSDMSSSREGSFDDHSGDGKSASQASEAYRERGFDKLLYRWPRSPASTPPPLDSQTSTGGSHSDLMNIMNHYHLNPNTPYTPSLIQTPTNSPPPLRSHPRPHIADQSNSYHVIFDAYSGRLVVLDEVREPWGRQTLVRILEYGCSGL